MMLKEETISYKLENTILDARQLTDVELVAGIIWYRNYEKTMNVARGLITKYGNLEEMARATYQELVSFPEMTPNNAKGLYCALNLSSRIKHTRNDKIRIVGSRTAFDLLQPDMSMLDHEEVWILCLSASNKVLQKIQVCSGGVTGCVMDARTIFRKALATGCAGIIVAHNHPSANANPSSNDICATKKIAEAGKALGMLVLDHIIIAGNRYYSFADEGML